MMSRVCSASSRRDFERELHLEEIGTQIEKYTRDISVADAAIAESTRLAGEAVRARNTEGARYHLQRKRTTAVDKAGLLANLGGAEDARRLINEEHNSVAHQKLMSGVTKLLRTEKRVKDARKIRKDHRNVTRAIAAGKERAEATHEYNSALHESDGELEEHAEGVDSVESELARMMAETAMDATAEVPGLASVPTHAPHERDGARPTTPLPHTTHVEGHEHQPPGRGASDTTASAADSIARALRRDALGCTDSD
jgi:hypothetical protein